MEVIFLLRYISIFLVLVSLLAVAVLPASAAVLDYNDYVSNVTVDGDNDLVTVNFPLNNVYFALYDYNTGTTAEAVSLSASFNLSANHRYNLFFLFYYPSDSLSLADIPSDTVFTVDADISSQHNFFDVSLEAFYNINYFYDSKGNYVGSTSNPVSVTDHYTFSSVLPQLASNFASFNPGLQWANWAANYDDTLSITVHSLTMQFSISSLLRLQQTTGKTNAILKEVEQKLADQGQTLEDVLGEQQDTNEKLDDIINGTVDPETPSGSDVVGDLDDAEGHIRDDASSGLQQGEQVQQNALQVLGQYLSAFACVSWIFDKFATIPLFSGLLALSFSLGICGAILGLGLSIASASDRRSRPERSKNNRMR